MPLDFAKALQQLRQAVPSVTRLGLPLLLPGIFLCVVDHWLRGPFLRDFDPGAKLYYRVGTLLSIAFWGGLVATASGPRTWPARFGKAILLGLGLTIIGNQLFTYGFYRSLLDHNDALDGTTLTPALLSRLLAQPRLFSKTFGATAFVLLGCAWLRERLRERSRVDAGARPLHSARKRSSSIAAAPIVKGKDNRGEGLVLGLSPGIDLAVIAGFVVVTLNPQRTVEQGFPPDVQWGTAFGQAMRGYWDHHPAIIRTHPPERIPQSVPKVRLSEGSGIPGTRRSVLLIINESVRADDTCIGHADKCLVTPFSNQALPKRSPLYEVRAMDSTTTISLGVLWTGLAPGALRSELATAPLLWDYAHAAGFATGYFTSQHLLFGNEGKWIEATHFDKFTSATHLEVTPSLDYGADDGKLVDHVLEQLLSLPDPFFAVVHFSNTHYPYLLDPDDAPFQPTSLDTGPVNHDGLVNHYRNSLYHQDRALGKLGAGVLAMNRPIVMMYTSDHGEQMHEHGPHGHTSSLYEEEVRVPTWLDGALSAQERERLTEIERKPILMLDLAPTVLDLLSLYDAPALAPFRQQMPGVSLFRGRTETAQFMTNCSTVWQCEYPNWGAISGRKKVMAGWHEWHWLCFDVEADPKEKSPLPRERCQDLINLAETRGRPFPKRQ
jgi:Sulfatase